MLQVEQLRRLAVYYRDLLTAISQHTGKHLIDLGATLRYGLTTDLGLFISDIKTVIEKDKLTFEIERISPEIVSNALTKSDRDDNVDQEEEEKIDPEKKTASSRLIAIYRKQEQDRYNRETTVGFPIVAGKYGNKKFCAPLFYFTVQVNYDPLQSEVTLIKNFETPAFNFNLIAKLVNTDEEAEVVRQKVLPLIHGEDFTWETIEKVIKMVAELIDAFKGLRRDTEALSSLKVCLDARENKGAKVFNAISIVNSVRSNAFLVDELLQLMDLEEINGETVVETILSDVPENIHEETDDPDDGSYTRPLLFPLQSNIAQKRAARKAEKARLMVIHGPPGTGKSQTIANLVCDLVAQNKSVLVASHQNKALEVVANKIPDIDYLAMSLLKGEKDSVKRLANQLAYFDTYVSNTSLTRLNEDYNATMNAIKDKEDEIRKLKVRFSELKTLERDKFPTYFKFHQLRDFNKICPDDVIPEGEEVQISRGLKEWCTLFKKVRHQFEELNKLFSEEAENQDNKETSQIATSLAQLVNHYETALKLCEEAEIISKLKEMANKSKLNYEDSLTYIKKINNWLQNFGDKYILEYEKLCKMGVGAPDIDEGKKIQSSLGENFWNHLLERAKELYKKTEEILKIDLPPNTFPQTPEPEDINAVEESLKALENAGWLKWHVMPRCISARKELVKRGVNSISYKTRRSSIEGLKAWVKYWHHKFELIESSISLKKSGIPIAEVKDTSSIAEIL